MFPHVSPPKSIQVEEEQEEQEEVVKYILV